MTRFKWFPLAICWLGLSSAAGADDQRFQAEFADGTRVNGDEIRNWHDANAQPVLANKPLLDKANPARWVIDTALKVSATPCRLSNSAGATGCRGLSWGRAAAPNLAMSGCLPI